MRYRIDGDLQLRVEFPIESYSAICARLKIMSGINIAERRIPQDGRIGMSINGTEYDFRVSTLPTVYGEKFVIRILDKTSFNFTRTELGFTNEENVVIDKILAHSYGIVLLTGPTGCGKSTTLYSFLKEINKPTVNVITIEDPVEYTMHGVNQVQVNDQFYADSSQRTFDKLVRGVWFSGDDYDSSQAVLDLSDWESSHAPHKLELSNGNTSISNCPAGTITISAVQAQVHIILPDGCSYGIGSAWRGYTYSNSMGGKYAVIYDTVDLIGFSDTDQGHSIDSYDTNYAWMTDDSKMPANGPELLVDIPFSAGARVNMTYISDWEGSTYMQFRNNFDTTNGYTEDSGKAE